MGKIKIFFIDDVRCFDGNEVYLVLSEVSELISKLEEK